MYPTTPARIVAWLHLQALTNQPGLSARMVPLSVGDDWRPISRTIHLPSIHRDHVGPTLRLGHSLVPYHGADRRARTEVRGYRGLAEDRTLRWMGLRHVNGRSRLARHLHDLVLGVYAAVDPWLSRAVVREP